MFKESNKVWKRKSKVEVYLYINSWPGLCQSLLPNPQSHSHQDHWHQQQSSCLSHWSHLAGSCLASDCGSKLEPIENSTSTSYVAYLCMYQTWHWHFLWLWSSTVVPSSKLEDKPLRPHMKLPMRPPDPDPEPVVVEPPWVVVESPACKCSWRCEKKKNMFTFAKKKRTKMYFLASLLAHFEHVQGTVDWPASWGFAIFSKRSTPCILKRETERTTYIYKIDNLKTDFASISLQGDKCLCRESD